MMSGGRMNAAATDDFPFGAMQPPPYVGFEHAGMVQAGGGGGGGQRHQGAMMYDNFDFAAAFGQFQDAPHHQMLSLPPSGNGAGGLVPMPMAPPPMPGMQLQMPPMAMHGHGDLYPALGMVKREGGGGGGAGDAGRIGLNLGRRTYFSPGDMMAVDRLLMRSRLGGVFGLGFGGAHHQPPRCQAEGCKADLSGAKHYHRRHKVCEYHAKASLVAAAGKQQRFCQQCSRFHVLTEFDEAKRSCRKRLAEHNRRRRKPATSSAVAATSKDSAPPPSKKPNAGAISSPYAADNNTLSAAKSTISSNTSAISCLQHGQSKAAAGRPMTLTLGEPRDKDDHQQRLNSAMQLHHHHQEQQHFITSLLQQQNNTNNNNGSNNNILSCSSVCSSALPSAAAANGEVSDQNNSCNHGGGNNNNNNNNNMHLFEVDFM